MIVRRKSRENQTEQVRLALWKAVVVRHRASGHVRFDLPAPLCTPEAAAVIETALRRVDGVYRVTMFAGQGKLSIRWAEQVCTLAQVAKVLATAVAAIAAGAPADGEAAPRRGVLQRIVAVGPVARLKERYLDLKAKGEILSRLIAVKTGRSVPMPFDAKDWALHFANDLVVFYLIRLHWDRIIRQWLPNPWAYRYQWATVVYLVFLLVRFRKAKK